MIFGIGFRLVLVALALVLERLGAWLRTAPWVRGLIASAPGREDAKPDSM